MLVFGCQIPNPAYHNTSPPSDAPFDAANAPESPTASSDASLISGDLSDAVVASADSGPRPLGGTALLIVWVRQNPSDDQIAARLVALGFSVNAVPDADVTSADVEAADLLVVSANADSKLIPVDLTDTAVPFVCFESFLFDDMGWTGPVQDTDYGLQFGHSIRITAPEHPLAAGRIGTVRLLSATQRLSWGRPQGAAISIAVLTDDASKVALFGYPTGAATLKGPVAAARVGLFATFVEFDAFTSEALALFDAAVRWAWTN